MASNLIHGREGALYLSTSSGDTAYGSEIAYTNTWSLSMSRDIAEVTPLNSNSKEYIEGLVSGTVSAEGGFRVSDTHFEKLINRFCDVQTATDTTGTPEDITDGVMYFHLFARLIDTAASSDEIPGAKYVVPVLSNGFTANANGGEIENWSYEGTVSGDVVYIVSTSTADGIPKKA